MANGIHKLKALTVEKISATGLYGDGGGLYLQITKAGVKSWLFRYMRHKKARGMGLGPLHTVSLADARVKAHNCRVMLLDGIDPLEAKQAQRKALALEESKTKTFEQCAVDYIEAHKAGWKNAKHIEQWTNTLKTYAYPVIGSTPVAAVDVALVKEILDPIWTQKTETASRIRGRIESVLDWATVHGYRLGDNPARWRGHLDKLLPRQSKVAKVQHHPALPYSEMPNFLKALRSEDGIAPAALTFLILTATRTSEVANASFDEIDLDAGIWTIPAERMKANRQHRVPLSQAAIAVVTHMKKFATSRYIFPGRQENKPLSNMAMLQLLKRMGRPDITTHGFRSTFRDWIAECTNHPREIAEAALAHTLNDKTEAAYQRGDLFDKRIILMNEWAAYCNSTDSLSVIVRQNPPAT
jgi:integrase